MLGANKEARNDDAGAAGDLEEEFISSSRARRASSVFVTQCRVACISDHACPHALIELFKYKWAAPSR
jgi:hypothetical protein